MPKSKKKNIKKIDKRKKKKNIDNVILDILKEISIVTSQNFKIERILDRFLDLSMEVIGADAGSILLIDKNKDTLYFAVAKGKKAEKLKNYVISIGEGIAGRVAQTGFPVITPDAKKDPRFSPKISKKIKYETKNILCVPLKFEDEVLGVIELLNKKNNEDFDDNDLDLLNRLSPYIAVIVKNAQLLLENKTKIEQLEHLMEITKYLNYTLKMENLLDKMLQISTDMLNAEAGSILLVDEKTDELIFSAITGEKKEKLKNIRVPIGEGIAGWVAREGEPLLIPDAQKDPRFYKKVDEKTNFKTRTIIAVPLKTKDRLVGVVEILNKKNNEKFNEEDKELLNAFANQAAVAIENAKLYENLEELFLDTVESLTEAIDKRDQYTSGHSERVNLYSQLIGKELNLSEEELNDLKLASLFHDIGKIGIEDRILRKPAKLNKAEFEEIKKHPEYSADIISKIPQLRKIVPVIKHHHERYDGHGYPDGLKEKDIPFLSRIISIADTFDAMSSDRPYRKALPYNVCLKEIENCSGTQFDPTIVPPALKALKKFLRNLKKEKDK